MSVRPMISDPFGGRSIEEWIGSSPDAKIPEKVRDRVRHQVEWSDPALKREAA